MSPKFKSILINIAILVFGLCAGAYGAAKILLSISFTDPVREYVETTRELALYQGSEVLCTIPAGTQLLFEEDARWKGGLANFSWFAQMHYWDFTPEGEYYAQE